MCLRGSLLEFNFLFSVLKEAKLLHFPQSSRNFWRTCSLQKRELSVCISFEIGTRACYRNILCKTSNLINFPSQDGRLVVLLKRILSCHKINKIHSALKQTFTCVKKLPTADDSHERKLEDVTLFHDFSASKKNKKYQLPKALQKPD